MRHTHVSIERFRDVCQLSDSLTGKMIFDAVTSVCNSDSQRLSGDVMVSEVSFVTTDSITDGSDVAR